MLTVEFEKTRNGTCTIATLMDPKGKADDIEVSWEENSPVLCIRQQYEDEHASVVALTPDQAVYLYKVLAVALSEEQ